MRNAHWITSILKHFLYNLWADKQIFTSLLIPSSASPYVYLYLCHYLLSISLPQWLEGVGGNGRDHYITKHPQATVPSNCHTRLPIHCLQASGQVLCGTLQMQGGWEEKVEWPEQEESQKRPGGRGRMGQKGRRNRKKAPGLGLPPGSKP